MALFGSFRKKEKTLALINLSSGSVSGLLMRIKKGQKPEIPFSFKDDFNLSSALQFDFLQREMERTLENVLKALVKRAGKQRINEVVCLLSAPWYTSQTRIIKFSDEKPFEITPSLINQFRDEEVENLRKQAQKYFSVSSTEIKFIEKEAARFVLNGYELENPFKKKVKELEFYLYLSAAKRQMVEKVDKIISRYLKVPDVGFFSVPFVSFSSLRDLVGLKEGFLFVDFAEEITETILVYENYIEEVSSFALGSGFFVRRLASSFNYGLTEAKSFLKQFEVNHLNQDERSKLETVVKEASNTWSDFLTETLEGMSKVVFLPRKIFFLGGGNLFSTLNEAVKSKRFSRLDRALDIERILPASLENYFIFPNKADKPSNVIMMLFALFINNRYRA